MTISNLRNRTARIALLVSLIMAIIVPSVKPKEVAYGYDNLFHPGLDIIADSPWRVEPGCSSIPILIMVKDLINEGSPLYVNRVEVRQRVLHPYPWPIPDQWHYDRLLESFPIDQELTGTNGNLYTEGDWYTTRSLAIDGTDEEGDGYHLTGLVYLQVKVVTMVDPEIEWLSYLGVNVAIDPLPSLPGLYPGDIHYHSSYTDNAAEWGAPIDATVEAGEAIGLDWNVMTDHAFDLRDNNDGTDVNDKWDSLKVDIADYSTDSYTVILGEEVSCYDYELHAYCDPTRWWPSNPGVIHFLALGLDNASSLGKSGEDFIPGYDDESLCYDPDEETWYLGDLITKLNKIEGAVGYAAHPEAYNKGTEELLGRVTYQDSEYNLFGVWDGARGLELWNGRRSDKDDWRTERDTAIQEWVKLLLKGRTVFVGAGSDAHGMFNRYDFGNGQLKGDDGAFGRVRTYVQLDSLDEGAILDALAGGHSIITDGPVVTCRVRNENDEVAIMGESIVGNDLTLEVEWRSTEEFHDVESITVKQGVIGGSETTIAQYFPHSLSGTQTFGLSTLQVGRKSYVRVYAKGENFTNYQEVEDDYHEAFTNPIWVTKSPGSAGNVDVMLIIDSSGSMSWNDPSEERLDAATAFLTACLVGDQVGVVDFATNAELLGDGLYALPENKDTLSSLIATIGDSGWSTNIRAGIEASCQELINDGRAARRGAILLTDGQHNEGSFGNPQQCFIDNGWPIYTFGFGSADATLLQQVAGATGGEYKHISDVFSLLCEFQRVRAMIAGVEPPPCIVDNIDPGETSTRFVDVPPNQAQATFSSNWLGSDIVMTLTTPSGRVIDRTTVAPDVTHDKGADFEVYTIMNPEAGSWQVDLFGLDVPLGGEDVIFGFVSIPWGSENQPPVAIAGPDQAVEGTIAGDAEVTLDGSVSYDPDGDPLTYTWTWAGGSGSGVSPTVAIPVGTTVVTLEVSDGALTDTDTVSITVLDATPPTVTVEFPTADLAVQDGVTLKAVASDLNGVDAVYFYIREPDCPQGEVISPEFEDLPATLNGVTGEWEYDFDTLALPDGNYIVLAKGVDMYDNEGWSDCVPFSIRNWAVIELLPASQSNKAGRTMPVKFALRVSALVDPEQPFVWNDELTIKIFATSNPGVILQTSTFGSESKDYRIDNDTLYITNFRTLKTPKQYTVEVWRTSKNFIVGSFTFATVK